MDKFTKELIECLIDCKAQLEFFAYRGTPNWDGSTYTQAKKTVREADELIKRARGLPNA